MGKYSLTEENKGAVDSVLDFPRLKLDKDEVARLAVIGIQNKDGKKDVVVPDIEGGYFFDLRGIDLSGEEKFYGRYECLAPEDAKQAGEYDPDECPHCELREKIPASVMGDRKRRWALPVIRYKTKPRSSVVQDPLSVEALLWVFTDRYFNVLVDEHKKWIESRGLLGHDLTLTCEVKSYQNFKISVEPDARWKQDKDSGKLVLGTLISALELAPDGFGRVLGPKMNRATLAEKIVSVYDEVKQAGGLATADSVPAADPDAIAGLAADLFSDDEAPSEPEPKMGDDPAPSTGESVEEFDIDGWFDGDS